MVDRFRKVFTFCEYVHGDSVDEILQQLKDIQELGFNVTDIDGCLEVLYRVEETDDEMRARILMEESAERTLREERQDIQLSIDKEIIRKLRKDIERFQEEGILDSDLNILKEEYKL